MKDGITPRLMVAMWVFVAIFLGVGLAGVFIGGDRDSTDTKTTRSGMELYTDALTGCQYLSAGGGITPRLDSDNMIVCNEASAK